LLYATCKRDANIISVMDSITGKTHDYSLGEIKSNGLESMVYFQTVLDIIVV